MPAIPMLGPTESVQLDTVSKTKQGAEWLKRTLISTSGLHIYTHVHTNLYIQVHPHRREHEYTHAVYHILVV